MFSPLLLHKVDDDLPSVVSVLPISRNSKQYTHTEWFFSRQARSKRMHVRPLGGLEHWDCKMQKDAKGKQLKQSDGTDVCSVCTEQDKQKQDAARLVHPPKPFCPSWVKWSTIENYFHGGSLFKKQFGHQFLAWSLKHSQNEPWLYKRN